MNNRYAFIFDYRHDGGWMMVLLENGILKHYYNSADNDWDQSLTLIDHFLENGGNLYEYKVPKYEDLNGIVPDDIDDVKFKDQPIKELEKYRVNR